MKAYDLAEQDYLRSTDINPRNQGSLHNLVLCQMEQKAYDLIPTGISEQLASCPLKLEDYQRLVQELDSIIKTFKK